MNKQITGVLSDGRPESGRLQAFRSLTLLAGFTRQWICGSFYSCSRGEASREEIIDLAFVIEKDSVVFYSMLKKYVGKEHEAAVENIIQEEVNHVLMLQKYKTQEIPAPPDVDAL